MYRNRWKLMLLMAFIALKLTNCELVKNLFEKAQKINSGKFHYCGERLTSALELICDGKYDRILYGEDEVINYEKFRSSRAARRAKMQSFDNARYRRQTDNIYKVNKVCCLNACSVDVMRVYCKSSRYILTK